MSPKIRLGVIGAGMIGDVHVKNARADGRAEVAWLAARSRETLDRKLKDHAVARGTLDYRDILDDPEIDAVVIATPPHTHLEMTLAALDAGKHILLEKPMCIRPDEARQIVSAVKARPKQVVLECSGRHARLQPKFRAVKKLVESGRLGRVYHIHHNALMRGTFIEWNPSGAWALDKAQAGGGPFLDWGVYDLSFHLGVLGDSPRLASLRSFTRGGLKKFKDSRLHQDIEEHGAAYMEFDGGLTYYYERGSGAHCEAANETRLNGTLGSARFGFCSWDPPEIEVFDLGPDGSERRETLPVDMTGHRDDNQEWMTHFLDCLLDGARPLMTVDLAARHLDILFRILDGPSGR